MYKKMKQFKIRCSAIGKIMTNARSKSETLSQTTKGYVEEWFKEQIYNRRKEFSNKYTEKGIIMEDNSLDYIAEQLGYGMLLKNEQYFENDYLTGTPDVILKDHLIDVKNSWDCFSFPLFETEIPNKDYYYQAQGYMALTGLNHFKVIYVLMNTPEHLIEKEFTWNNPLNLEYGEFRHKFVYDGISSDYRIKVYTIQRNDDDIQAIYKRVEECRDYINTLSI